MTRSLFIGRWQPLHAGHIVLIRTALDAGNQVAVGIRDTAKDEDNPYSVEERRRMIRDVFGDGVEIFIVPDFDEICYGRRVGYTFREIRLEPEVEAVSATEIRRQGDKETRGQGEEEEDGGEDAG